MSDEVALCLYRVVQETLRNVAKHAQARRAHVSLSRHNGTVAMSVADDGSGFPADEFFGAQGLGLTSLNERVVMLGGTFAVKSSPGQGTTVSVTVPTGEVHAT
jgi:signal transduction histidine kinase